MELPRVVVLNSSTGDHLGFLLLRRDDDGPAGQCVFQLLPAKSDVFESPLFQNMEAFGFRAAGEMPFQATRDTDLCITVSPGGKPHFEIRIPSSGKGSFRAIGSTDVHGVAFALPVA
jgi:hypothetical protein